MRLAICNEVLRELSLEAQFEHAAALGYDGVELAPFTLGADPRTIGAREIRAVRAAAAASGVAVSGLHWLLLAPDGLSITSPDPRVRDDTLQVLRAVAALCAELGGDYLVHGSPAQRALPGEGPEREAAFERGFEALAVAARAAESAGVTWCLEPLAAPQDAFATCVADAVAIVERVGSPALRTMLDCRAARVSDAEAESPESLVTRWVPSGHVAHIQVNDSNRRGPGQGADPFAAVIAALDGVGYSGWVAVEPFDYVPDGPGCAAFSAGYLRGVAEGLAFRRT